MNHEENSSSCCETKEKINADVPKKKCCQTHPEIKQCACKSKKEKSLLTYFSELFRKKE